MLALLELELAVTAAVLVIQIRHFPLKIKKEAQVSDFDRESSPLAQFLTFPAQAYEVFSKSAAVTRRQSYTNNF